MHSSEETEIDLDDKREEHDQNIAEATAAYAHLGYFSSRRGVMPSDRHLLIIYDNNPYAGDKERRRRELDALKKAMADNGAKLLAEGSYPKANDEQPGYTRTVIWQDEDDRLSKIVGDVWNGIIRTEQVKADNNQGNK